MQVQAEFIPELIAELKRGRFWGSLQIDFQNGEVLLIRKTETLKVSPATPNPTKRTTYNGQSHQ